MFSSIKIYLIIAAAIIMAGLYFYISYLNKSIDLLKAKNIAQEIQIKQNEDTIKIITESFEKLSEVNNKISNLRENDISQQEKLNSALTKLQSTSQGKPKLVENIINKASKDRNRCLELATGAPKKQNEKNRICPQLLK